MRAGVVLNDQSLKIIDDENLLLTLYHLPTLTAADPSMQKNTVLDVWPATPSLVAGIQN